MATGDAAALEGFTPVSPAADIRLGYDDINRLADWVAGRTTGRRIGASGRAAMGTLSGSGSSYEKTVTVTLPSGRFTTAPRIALAIESIVSTQDKVGVSDVTATSFTIYYWRENNTTTAIQWVALENG